MAVSLSSFTIPRSSSWNESSRSLLQLLFQHLSPEERGVGTSPLEEFGVSAPLHDGSILENQDLICVHHGGDPVADSGSERERSKTRMSWQSCTGRAVLVSNWPRS